MMSGADKLQGLTVLVVEDETIVSFLIEDTLMQLGCKEVWHASAIAAALALLQDKKPDAAVLDVNLSGVPAYPVAERLAALGVPFVFATGYGKNGVASEWRDRPVIQKPFDEAVLLAGLISALAG